MLAPKATRVCVQIVNRREFASLRSAHATFERKPKHKQQKLGAPKARKSFCSVNKKATNKQTWLLCCVFSVCFLSRFVCRKRNCQLRASFRRRLCGAPAAEVSNFSSLLFFCCLFVCLPSAVCCSDSSTNNENTTQKLSKEQKAKSKLQKTKSKERKAKAKTHQTKANSISCLQKQSAKRPTAKICSFR